MRACRSAKSAYELSRSQVSTPRDIVRLFWDITGNYRSRLHRVLDLGAGDGRFAFGGDYDDYTGIEIDRTRPSADLPSRARIKYQCVFKYSENSFDDLLHIPCSAQDLSKWSRFSHSPL